MSLSTERPCGAKLEPADCILQARSRKMRVMTMNFPAKAAVGDVHTFTDDKGHTTNFQWDGISWNRMDDIPSSPAPPRLKLHRVSGSPREDYEVIDARGEKVGRISLTDAEGGGEVWNWTIYGTAVTNPPPAGQAPTRGAAQAAVKAAWATCQPRQRGA
jgi:hypothetical protein